MRRPQMPYGLSTPTDEARMWSALGAILADDHDAAAEWTPPPPNGPLRQAAEVVLSFATAGVVVAVVWLLIVAVAA